MELSMICDDPRVTVKIEVLVVDRHFLNKRGRLLLDAAIMELKADLKIYSRSIITTLTKDSIEVVAKNFPPTLAPVLQMLVRTCQRRVTPICATVSYEI
jgi:hypothetical protein